MIGLHQHVLSQLLPTSNHTFDSLVSATFYFEVRHQALPEMGVWAITEITKITKKENGFPSVNNIMS